MQIDLTPPSTNTSTTITSSSTTPSTVNVIIPIPVTNPDIPQLNFSSINGNSTVATINTTHTVALSTIPTDNSKANISTCPQNSSQPLSDITNNSNKVQISPIRRHSEETTKWFYEEWEKRTLVIEETLQSIDKIFASSQHQNIDLTTSIDTLINQVKVIAELYHKIKAKLAVPEEYLCSKYPKKKAKSYVLALCSGTSSLIGFGSMAIEGLQAQYRCNSTLNWVGIGFLLGGALMGKASLVFSNAWGNEEKEKGKLKEIASKASIITNTRATIKIFEEYNKFVREEKHQKNREMVKEKIGKLLRKIAKREGMESPLLKLDRRLRTIFQLEMAPLEIEFQESKKTEFDRKISHLDRDDDEEDSMSQIVYDQPPSFLNPIYATDNLKMIKVEEVTTTPPDNLKMIQVEEGTATPPDDLKMIKVEEVNVTSPDNPPQLTSLPRWYVDEAKNNVTNPQP